MEERNSMVSCDQKKGQSKCSAAPFFIGVVAALVVGWWFFPKALFSEQHQPVKFSHKLHMEEAGMECATCHYFNEDGSYHGLPTTEDCAACHADMLGENPEEVKFITDYVDREREVNWLVYQKQPDNVFFSHAVHTLDNCGQCHDYNEAEMCSHCHPNVAEMDEPPAYHENRLTKYSKDTMKMYTCEECHALADHRENTNASNACFVCHK